MPKNSTVIGVDLGGTKTAIARYDSLTGECLAQKVFETRAEDGFSAVRDDLVSQISELRDDSTAAVGIGVPGLVDIAGKKILVLPNIPGSENQELAEYLTSKLTLPVKLGNDADLFTLAEAKSGAGKNESVVLGITIGTGVGGGIVIDGKLFRGAHGYAGEVGHMLLMPGKPPYETSDKRGDVEQFLSGTALGKRCEKASDPSQYLQGATCSYLHPDIFREIAWMIVNMSHLLDPSIVVLGGSAGKALKPHLAAIREELSKWMLPGSPTPKLAVSEIADAATRGAALLVL